MVTKLSKIPLQYQPGSRWHYSVAVDVQGRLVEVLSGERLDEYFREHIFEPLNMTDTAFVVSDDQLARFTTNYGPGGNGLIAIDRPGKSQYRQQPGLLSGGGGLVSTSRDYLRFCQMLLNGGELDGERILSAETVAEMTRNHLSDELMPIGFGIVKRPGVGFGLGFSVRVEATGDEPSASVGEYGWGGAASTNFWINPQQKLIAIAMTQHMPLATKYATDLHDIVYDAITEVYEDQQQPVAAGTGQ